MPSPFAADFHAKVRPFLWGIHKETLPVSESVAGDPVISSIDGVWHTVAPIGAVPITNGSGIQAYTGQAWFTVYRTTYPTEDDLPGATAVITRHGEEWAIRLAQPMDAYTWILHLSKPDPNLNSLRR